MDSCAGRNDKYALCWRAIGCRLAPTWIAPAGLAGLLAPPQFAYGLPPYPPGGSKSVAIFAWSSSGIDLYIDGTRLKDSGEAANSTLAIRSAPQTPQEIETPTVVVPHVVKSDIERLFLETVLDIEGKVLDNRSYSLLRAAGLLRQLLLDQHPLINEVNKQYHIPIRFEIIDNSMQPPFQPDIWWVNPDPSNFQGANVTKVSRDKFLKTRCLFVGPDEVTVRDFIRACSHVKGGVHVGMPESHQEELVIQTDKQVRILASDLSLATIGGICTVVLKAVRPIVSEIMSRSAS